MLYIKHATNFVISLKAFPDNPKLKAILRLLGKVIIPVAGSISSVKIK